MFYLRRYISLEAEDAVLLEEASFPFQFLPLMLVIEVSHLSLVVVEHIREATIVSVLCCNVGEPFLVPKPILWHRFTIVCS